MNDDDDAYDEKKIPDEDSIYSTVAHETHILEPVYFIYLKFCV